MWSNKLSKSLKDKVNIVFTKSLLYKPNYYKLEMLELSQIPFVIRESFWDSNESDSMINLKQLRLTDVTFGMSFWQSIINGKFNKNIKLTFLELTPVKLITLNEYRKHLYQIRNNIIPNICDILFIHLKEIIIQDHYADYCEHIWRSNYRYMNT